MDLLITLTQITDFLAFTTTLWLAFYLLGRGFPSTITLRAVVVLLALSTFFYGAFYNIHEQIAGTAVIRSILLIIGMTLWYSLTFKLLTDKARHRLRWMEWGFYTLSTITAVLLFFARDAFVGEVGNSLYVGRMGMGLPFALFGFTQATIAFGIIFNLVSDNKIGFTPQGHYFLYASIFPVVAIGYGIHALALIPPMPRLIQDGLVFCGIFLLGVSVARYQTLIERRTTIHDFPLSAVTMFAISVVYFLIAQRIGLGPELAAAIAGFAILTHSLYDLVREFLERKRLSRESAFRQQLRRIESLGTGEEKFQPFIQEGLELLCQTLHTIGGFVALHNEKNFVIAASKNSLPVDSHLDEQDLVCDDICPPPTEKLKDTAWLAPAFEGEKQVAIIGIRPPENKLHYSSEELDLLAEVADRIGTVVSLSHIQPQKTSQIAELVAELDSGQTELHASAKEMLASMASNPPAELIKMVEDCLRNLHDFITLGQHPLADLLEMRGETHVERGKKLQESLIAAIETLRPAGKRPAEPLPRVWYNYVVLYDAYVQDIQNREIMARLYISEGTFNRTRRSALRGLCRLLAEKMVIA